MKPSFKQVSYKCRRGMLELDICLTHFLNKHYHTLTGEQQSQFLNLLDYPDPILLDWILGKDVPHDPVFYPLIEKIRLGSPL